MTLNHSAAVTAPSEAGHDSVAATVERLVHFFEHLSPQDLPRLGELYAPNARFKDPFNEVQGVAAIEHIFQHMFASLDLPHFVVTGRVRQDRECVLLWDFRFRFQRFDTERWQTVRGSTHLVFDEGGQVEWHRDYWDAAEELYEKIPGLRALMRWLKRQATR
jgi:steroid Delta-isomerase